MRQLRTFGVFAAGYLARPLGGIVMAHFGDTRGRKRMFTLSVLLMTIPTLLIGFLVRFRVISGSRSGHIGSHIVEFCNQLLFPRGAAPI
jgi:MFS family permease